ncbi:hypothetical protein SUGI_0844110 [Cryptomeria japonica]|nr:hypothetical protein SUGI_0844110 [Cryptomeria japonica]
MYTLKKTVKKTERETKVTDILWIANCLSLSRERPRRRDLSQNHLNGIQMLLIKPGSAHIHRLITELLTHLSISNTRPDIMPATGIPDAVLHPLREILKLVLTKASVYYRMAFTFTSDCKGKNDTSQVSENEKQHKEEIKPEQRSDSKAGAHKACQ